MSRNLRDLAAARLIFANTGQSACFAILTLMQLRFSTKGFNEVLNITDNVEQAVQNIVRKLPPGSSSDGVAHLFVAGSTAALTTIEFEPGAVADLLRALEQIAPIGGEYEHNKAWGDGNGYAHLRAALLKADLCVPYSHGKLSLGTWQQIILVDFDNRPRERIVRLSCTASLPS